MHLVQTSHSILHSPILHSFIPPFPIPAHSNDDRAIPNHVAVEGDYIYWTDIHYNTLNRALKSSGNQHEKLAEGAEPVSTVIVVKKSQLRRRGDPFSNFLLCMCTCAVVESLNVELAAWK